MDLMVGKYKEDYDYFDFEKCYQFLELRSRVKLRFVTYVAIILGLSKPVDDFFFSCCYKVTIVIIFVTLF